METTTNTATIKGNWQTRQIWVDGKELTPNRSQKIRNHSPDGFNWSYGGSGPAQLALALMLHFKNTSEGYQDFKFDVIAALPKSDFEIVLDVETMKVIQ